MDNNSSSVFLFYYLSSIIYRLKKRMIRTIPSLQLLLIIDDQLVSKLDNLEVFTQVFNDIALHYVKVVVC